MTGRRDSDSDSDSRPLNYMNVHLQVILRDSDRCGVGTDACFPRV